MPNAQVFENKTTLLAPKIYELDIEGLKSTLVASPEKSKGTRSNVIVSFPNADGKIESFRVYEHSNFAPELAAKYPEIKSYIGESVDNTGSNIYFSVSPLGLSTMEINLDRSSIFIEPYTKDLKTYAVYRKNERTSGLNKWECTVVDEGKKATQSTTLTARPNADDGLL